MRRVAGLIQTFSGEKAGAWLAGEPPVLASDINTVVQFFPVSPKMNKPSHNAPDCVQPLVDCPREESSIA